MRNGYCELYDVIYYDQLGLLWLFNVYIVMMVISRSFMLYAAVLIIYAYEVYIVPINVTLVIIYMLYCIALLLYMYVGGNVTYTG